MYKLCSDAKHQPLKLLCPFRYKSGFKRAALKLLGVDTYSCVALHMDVIKPLPGTAAYMQACHPHLHRAPEDMKGHTA